jgi:predicted porin
MKKTLVALAALSAIAGAAQAQSTVTLYGLLDQNVVRYHQNTTTGAIDKTAFVDGGFNGSRFGLKGSEDLGGGLSAIFNFEAGVNSDSGTSTQGSTLFGRRSIVGLSGATWGTVGIGRNSSPYDDVEADHAMMQASVFDPSGTNNAPQTLYSTNTVTAATAATTLLARGAAGNGNATWIGYSTRFNNSVKYQSPVFSGFSFSAMYATGEDNTVGAAAKDASSSTGANAKYEAGPLLVSFGYQSEAAGGTSSTTATGLAGATSLLGTNQNSAANAAAAVAGLHPALTNTQLNAAYDFGVARVGLGINQAKFQDVKFVPQGGVAGDFAAQNEYSLSVSVPFGATLLSAGYAVSQGDSLGKASGYGLQAKYALSKRTFLYGGYSNLTPFDTLVNLANASKSISTDNVSSYGVGIQHKF